MSYGDNGLSFRTLHDANARRVTEFKNAKGEISHPNGHENWSLTDWCTAACGELGEAANLIKKIRRGDFTLDETREDLGRELADTVTYLDLLAQRAGIDLGAAVASKFNEISKRVGSRVYIGPDDDWHLKPETEAAR